MRINFKYIFFGSNYDHPNSYGLKLADFNIIKIRTEPNRKKCNKSIISNWPSTGKWIYFLWTCLQKSKNRSVYQLSTLIVSFRSEFNKMWIIRAANVVSSKKINFRLYTCHLALYPWTLKNMNYLWPWQMDSCSLIFQPQDCPDR